MSINTPISSTDNQRSPFILSGLEIALAILVGLASWFGLRGLIRFSLPFPCETTSSNLHIDCGWTEEQAWQTFGNSLFSTYVVPLVSILAISSIFLVRSIRHDVRHLSIMANLALSWPLFAFLGFWFLSIFSLICFPMGLALAIIATINSGMKNRNKLDWVSFPFSLAWLIVFGMFVGEYMNLYGD